MVVWCGESLDDAIATWRMAVGSIDPNVRTNDDMLRIQWHTCWTCCTICRIGPARSASTGLLSHSSSGWALFLGPSERASVLYLLIRLEAATTLGDDANVRHLPPRVCCAPAASSEEFRSKARARASCHSRPVPMLRARPAGVRAHHTTGPAPRRRFRHNLPPGRDSGPDWCRRSTSRAERARARACQGALARRAGE